MDYLRKLLKPDKKKIILTALLPIVVLFVVTGSLDTLLDFYGYLLSPTMGIYDGTRTYRQFNQYVLMWVPIYVGACMIVEFLSNAGFSFVSKYFKEKSRILFL